MLPLNFERLNFVSDLKQSLESISVLISQLIFDRIRFKFKTKAYYAWSPKSNSRPKLSCKFVKWERATFIWKLVDGKMCYLMYAIHQSTMRQ